MNISNISTNNLNYLQNSLNNQPKREELFYTKPDKGNQFAQMLEDSINALNSEQLIAEHHKRDIASGEVKDLQKAIIEIDRAALSISLAGEVKNKILAAYKEIMNTQV